MEWDKIKGLVANRLIASDKCPVVGLIGIGEALQRILEKNSGISDSFRY